MWGNVTMARMGASTGSSWKPLLTGLQTERARSILDEIVDCLLVPPDQLPNLDLGALAISLGNGSAGIALALGHLSRLYPRRGIEDAAVRCLEHALDGCAVGVVQPSLYNGFTGVGWVVEHLTDRLLDGDGDPNEDMSDALARLVRRGPWRAPVELVEGIAGFGLFALERHRRRGDARLVPYLLDRLEECAERGASGCTWFTPPDLLPASFGEVAPNGYYNLGVAHGVPGVIGFLAASHRAGVEPARCARLLEESLHWLLAQRIEGESDSRFHHSIGPGIEPVPARTAWCYGDLGIALVVLAAARTLGRVDWWDAAIDLGLRAARRSREQAGVVDACLCHGSAGNAHLFNRLFQATGNPIFAEAALDWYEHLLAQHEPGQGLAGYRIWSGDGRGNRDWNAVPGFLIGVAGIALALAAALSADEPAWDRLLLADIEPLDAAVRGMG